VWGKFHGIPPHEGFFSKDFHFYDYFNYSTLITSIVMQGKAPLSRNYFMDLELCPYCSHINSLIVMFYPIPGIVIW